MAIDNQNNLKKIGWNFEFKWAIYGVVCSSIITGIFGDPLNDLWSKLEWAGSGNEIRSLHVNCTKWIPWKIRVKKVVKR